MEFDKHGHGRPVAPGLRPAILNEPKPKSPLAKLMAGAILLALCWCVVGLLAWACIEVTQLALGAL